MNITRNNRVSPPDDGQDPLIILKSVTKVYDMGKEKVHALRGMDLTIKPNEYISIMGPSGSGKSTLMNIIGCLDTPTSGRYEFEGELVCDVTDDSLNKMNDNQLADIRNRKIGFVFQTFNLLSRTTALRNVELPLIYAGVHRRERLERAVVVMDQVGLADRASHRPSELSGGERQRVAIARALVTRPTIILADEPTGNLDSVTGREIMVLLDDLYDKGNTIVLVTHEAHIAEHANRVIHLLDGQIARDEPTANSRRSPGEPHGEAGKTAA